MYANVSKTIAYLIMLTLCLLINQVICYNIIGNSARLLTKNPCIHIHTQLSPVPYQTFNQINFEVCKVLTLFRRIFLA